MPSIKLISLGCSKNTVDSENLLGNLLPEYWTIIPSDRAKDPDVMLINTCGFILDAKEESINTILQCARLKAKGRIRHLYVMGCLSKRYGHELKEEIKEVDEWFGVDDMPKIVEKIVGKSINVSLEERYLTTPSHYAYLKISEGCNRACAFCAIPAIRGRHVSRSIESILVEARALVSKGVKELIIVAQDVCTYGLDLYGEQSLTELLKELEKIEGLEWIRLQYLYPHSLPKGLLDFMASSSKVCKYVDIPIQHISSSVLSKMNRSGNEEEVKEVLQQIRQKMPEAAIRTTIIVGFPNESKEDFEKLCSFVEDFRFDRLGVFTYSMEDGTPAEALGDPISEEEKQERADALMEIQENIVESLSQKHLGKTYNVLFDREEGDYFVGRTQWDSPEVDGEVLVEKNSKSKGLKLGNFYKVLINEAETHDLYGELA